MTLRNSRHLEDVPIFPGTPAQQKAARTRQESKTIEDGRNAFLAGAPLSACPPFKDPEVAEWWRWAWNAEKSDRAAKQPRDRRLFHPEVMEKRARREEAGLGL